MNGPDFMFAPPPTKNSTGATARPPKVVASQPCADKRPIVLDMGEESRMQGFRQNGCR